MRNQKHPEGNAATLAHPLSIEQITGAQKIYSHLNQWRASDEALHALAERFPGFDGPSTLLKVVTVNALYGTNLYAVIRMADHIQRVMAKTKGSRLDISVVDRIAFLPPATSNDRGRHHLSFASKFAHFFIDSDKFPILDSYAESMLRKHLGASQYRQQGLPRYLSYVNGLAILKKLSGWTGSYRELDHYLWLAGTYGVWRNNPRAQINSELQRVFSIPWRSYC